MNELTLDVERRETRGKNANRRLRADNKVPAVVYGGALDSFAVQVDRKAMVTMVRQGGENSVFVLRVPGTDESRHTMIKAMQVHPISRRILHVDFQRIEMTETVRVKVAISLTGEADGVKNDGGVLEFVTREVEVECLPGVIPAEIELDVSPLNIGMHLEASVLGLPEGVELIEDPERVIVLVAAPHVEEEEETEEDDLLETEGEEPGLVSEEASDEGDEDK